jgi:hypothetical protein
MNLRETDGAVGDELGRVRRRSGHRGGYETQRIELEVDIERTQTPLGQLTLDDGQRQRSHADPVERHAENSRERGVREEPHRWQVWPVEQLRQLGVGQRSARIREDRNLCEILRTKPSRRQSESGCGDTSR